MRKGKFIQLMEMSSYEIAPYIWRRIPTSEYETLKYEIHLLLYERLRLTFRWLPYLITGKWTPNLVLRDHMFIIISSDILIKFLAPMIVETYHNNMFHVSFLCHRLPGLGSTNLQIFKLKQNIRGRYNPVKKTQKQNKESDNTTQKTKTQLVSGG